MMLIHFPIALLCMDLVFSIAGAYIPELSETAYYCLIAGVIGGWLAILAGILDLFRHILQHGAKATRMALVHGGIQSVIILTFTVFLSLEYKDHTYIANQPVWLLSGKIVLILAMLYGNYLGGELVMKYIAKEFQQKDHGANGSDSHH
jgi:uncharacterized membrane protein